MDVASKDGGQFALNENQQNEIRRVNFSRFTSESSGFCKKSGLVRANLDSGKALFEIFRKSKSFFLKSLIRVLETVSQIQLSFLSKKVVFGTEFDFLQHQLSNLTNNVNHTRFTIFNHG